MVHYDTVQYGMAMVRYCRTRYGTAQHGTVWHSTARYGKLKCRAVQSSAGKHITSQRSTAQCGEGPNTA